MVPSLRIFFNKHCRRRSEIKFEAPQARHASACDTVKCGIHTYPNSDSAQEQLEAFVGHQMFNAYATRMNQIHPKRHTLSIPDCVWSSH
jgi:hypothetical protein